PTSAPQLPRQPRRAGPRSSPYGIRPPAPLRPEPAGEGVERKSAAGRRATPSPEGEAVLRPEGGGRKEHGKQPPTTVRRDQAPSFGGRSPIAETVRPP